MSDTTSDTTLDVTQWERDYFTEYVRQNEFAPYMGTSSNSLAVVNENLTSNPGSAVVIPLVGALSNAAVTGGSTLEGNEEALNNYGHTINCAFRRNAVRVDGQEQADNAIDLLNAGRDMLMAWSMDDMRDRIVAALGSYTTSATVYTSTSEANKGSWLDDNSDRFVIANQAIATSGNDHSALLDELDGANDKFTPTILGIAKRKAKTASPAIRPFRVSGKLNEEWYVMFVSSAQFRDFKATLVGGNAGDYYNRGERHPIIRDGDIVYDGCIIREVPSIGTVAEGASSIAIAQGFLCGAQAIGVGFKQRSKAIMDTFDYGHKKGVGVCENSGVEKLISDFGTAKQHGVVTVWTASVADVA